MKGRVGAHPKNLAVKLTKSLLDLSAEEGSTLHMGGRGGGGEVGGVLQVGPQFRK